MTIACRCFGHVKLVLDLRYISGNLKFLVVVQVSFGPTVPFSKAEK